MTEASAQMSMADLEKELAKRRSDLTSLERKKERLLLQLDQVNEDIAELRGYGVEGGSRPKNEKSLKEHVEEILGRYKKGLPLNTLAEKVLEAGYNTTAANFNNNVYQCVYGAENIERDEKTSHYILK